MRCRARWADNVLMERWSGTLKSERLRNAEYETPAQLEGMIRGFIGEYSTTRPHPVAGLRDPVNVDSGGIAEAA